MLDSKCHVDVSALRAELGTAQGGLARENGALFAAVSRWATCRGTPSRLGRKRREQLRDSEKGESSPAD
jgi:hypothetical protein